MNTETATAPVKRKNSGNKYRVKLRLHSNCQVGHVKSLD